MPNSVITPTQSVDWLDIIFKFATVTIAIFNVVFAIVIFRTKLKIDDTEKERDRRLQLIKTLVLDHTLKYFYEVFDLIEVELNLLKVENINVIKKSEINDNLSLHFISLRRKFYDLFLAVDIPLFNRIKETADKLQDDISNSIFDSGVNLSHSPKFEELIVEKITTTKSDIVKHIFAYRA